MTGKKVNMIENSPPDRVSATTEDGFTFSGNIIVGADGVHSTIRREMARLDPGSGKDYLAQNGEN